MNLASINRPGIIILALIMLLLLATGAIGVIWIRQQISVSAHHCQALERDITEFKRKNDFLDTKIAQAHNPEFLKAHLQEPLGIPARDQVVYANLRMEPFSPRIEDNQPFVLAFNLALTGDTQNSSM